MYTVEFLENLKQAEALLQFERFDQEDAYRVGTMLRQAGLAGVQPVAVRVVLDDFDETAEETVIKGEEDHRDACELAMATLLYYHLVKLCGFTQSWGVLTGVRPVKLLRRLPALPCSLQGSYFHSSCKNHSDNCRDKSTR